MLKTYRTIYAEHLLTARTAIIVLVFNYLAKMLWETFRVYGKDFSGNASVN